MSILFSDGLSSVFIPQQYRDFDVPMAICVTELSFGMCDVLYSEIRTDVSEKPTTVTCTHNESGGFLPKCQCISTRLHGATFQSILISTEILSTIKIATMVPEFLSPGVKRPGLEAVTSL